MLHVLIAAAEASPPSPKNYDAEILHNLVVIKWWIIGIVIVSCIPLAIGLVGAIFEWVFG